MEGFEEPLILNSVNYGIKDAVPVDEAGQTVEVSSECPKSNGELFVEYVTNEEKEISSSGSGSLGSETVLPLDQEVSEETEVGHPVQEPKVESIALEDAVESSSNHAPETDKVDKDSSTLSAEVNEPLIESEKILCAENVVQLDESVVDSHVEISSENVTFETEVLVEQNETVESNETVVKTDDLDSTNHLLNDLGSNLELSDVLRSDATEPSENNNSSVREEVFNKEELLDILQGNDVEVCSESIDESSILPGDTPSEVQIALDQLKRLKRPNRVKATILDKKLQRKSKANKKSLDVVPADVRDKKPENKQKDEDQNNKQVVKRTSLSKESNQEIKKVKKNDSLASVLDTVIKDWEDEDTVKEEQENTKPSEDVSNPESTAEEESNAQEPTLANVDTNVKQTTEASQPQRRLSRIIKKKIIFDPDNPDTFTKGKASSKKKDAVEKSLTDTEDSKIKVEPTDGSPSKSPVSKMMWKKPTPKNSKQYKRLTEVDKLLMDEGAVNMIYQLTPEAPKGRKNMRTKAEFIKKLQSSTNDGSEMKFRERKKEIAKEDGEAKKISSGKQRSSMSSSVKSSACEDFETHSADDSIIYRRHSSSSYSSNCMSPRRLSDGEVTSANSKDSQIKTVTIDNVTDEQSNEETNLFKTNATCNDVINKDDCLSIKEKLNSKLSQVLSKRKRENNKEEKPVKQKKVVKSELKDNSREQIKKITGNGNYKNLTLTFEQSLARLIIKGGNSFMTEVFKELQDCLTLIDNRKDISVTLIMSDCGTLCSLLDFKGVLSDNVESRKNYAFENAESIRNIQMALEQHSKLLCGGVWGKVRGAGLALSALCDVLFAADSASFAMSALGEVPFSSATALLCRSTQLSGSFVKDVVVFNRSMTAGEAHQAGLVTRLWPATSDVSTQIAAFTKDLAAKPIQNTLLRKQLLNLSKSEESRAQFLSTLVKERNLLVEYWTSTEGQDSIRNYLVA